MVTFPQLNNINIHGLHHLPTAHTILPQYSTPSSSYSKLYHAPTLSLHTTPVYAQVYSTTYTWKKLPQIKSPTNKTINAVKDF